MRNRGRYRVLQVGVAFAAVMAIWGSGVTQVSAETRRAAMIRVCPNGAVIKSLSQQSDEAQALADAKQYQLNKELARNLFRCSSSVTGLYHDVALLLYGSTLSISIKTNGDAIQIAPEVIRRMNDLAAATSDESIKREALRVKGVTQLMYQSADQAINPRVRSDLGDTTSPNSTLIVGSWRTSYGDSATHQTLTFNSAGTVTTSLNETGTWRWDGGQTFGWIFKNGSSGAHDVRVSPDGLTLSILNDPLWSAKRM